MKMCGECGCEFDEEAEEIVWDYDVCFSCNESILAEEQRERSDEHPE
jgi:hypothetical protein